MKSIYKTYSALLFTLLVWSSDYILGKYFNMYLPSIYTTSLRFGLAVCGLFLLLWKRHECIVPSKKTLLKLALLGLCGIGIYNPMGYIALRYTGAINSVMLNAFSPCVTALLCFLFFKEKLTSKQFICMVVGITGIFIIATKGNIYQQLLFNHGDIMVIGNVCLWALYSVFGKQVMQGLTPLQGTFYTCLFGFLFMLPAGIWERVHVEVNTLPVGVYVGIAYMGILGSCFGMLFWYEAVMKLGPFKTSMLYNLIPLFTTCLAVVFHMEELQLYHVFGGILLISSSLLLIKYSQSELP